MNNRLVGYHAGTSFLHRLSGASKLLFLLLVSLAAIDVYKRQAERLFFLWKVMKICAIIW